MIHQFSIHRGREADLGVLQGVAGAIANPPVSNQPQQNGAAHVYLQHKSPVSMQSSRKVSLT